MTTTKPAEPVLAAPRIHEASRRTVRLEVHNTDPWTFDGLEATTVIVNYHRASVDDSDAWDTAVAVHGRKLKKNGQPGTRRTSTLLVGDPEDWPAWARNAAELYHPDRPRNADGTPGDPEGSYLR